MATTKQPSAAMRTRDATTASRAVTAADASVVATKKSDVAVSDAVRAALVIKTLVATEERALTRVRPLIP